MKLPTLLLLLLTLFLSASTGSAQDRSVTVTADAPIIDGNAMAARKQALANAFREAVEQGLGVLVESNTLVHNAAIIADNIYTKSQGYVKDHEILSEGPGQEDMYKVTMRATVNLTEIGTDLRALGILKDMMGNPKILSMIEEITGEPENPVLVRESSASIAVEEALRAHHFDLVDRDQVNQIRSDEMKRMGDFFVSAAYEDPDAIARIAARAQGYGAQYLLLGTARVEPGAAGGAARTSNATLKCKVVDAATAEKVALTQNAESGRGVDRRSADLYAAQRAGQVAAAVIIPQIVENWSRRANEGVAYLVKLYGVTSYGKQGRVFVRSLGALAGVTQCNRRQWDAKLGRLEVDLAFKGGSADDLVDAIFGIADAIPGFENLDLEEQTGNNLNFRIK
jgi:hypothetical protein